LAARENVTRHFSGRNGAPLYFEASSVSEKRAANFVLHIDLNVEVAIPFVVPLAHIRDTAKDHRKVETNRPFVEALSTRTEANTTLLVR
jgi:hypothetical protein